MEGEAVGGDVAGKWVLNVDYLAWLRQALFGDMRPVSASVFQHRSAPQQALSGSEFIDPDFLRK